MQLHKSFTPPSAPRRQYDFDLIQVGDAASFPADHSEQFPSIRSALSSYAKRNGRKFSTWIQDGALWIHRQPDKKNSVGITEKPEVITPMPTPLVTNQPVTPIERQPVISVQEFESKLIALRPGGDDVYVMPASENEFHALFSNHAVTSMKERFKRDWLVVLMPTGIEIRDITAKANPFAHLKFSGSVERFDAPLPPLDKDADDDGE